LEREKRQNYTENGAGRKVIGKAENVPPQRALQHFPHVSMIILGKDQDHLKRK